MTEERPAPVTQRASQRRVLVDAHVHLYPNFDRAVFLQASVRHAGEAGADLPWLLLTETSRDFAYRGLMTEPPVGWSVRRHDDGHTLTLADTGGSEVMVTAGRQVQTEEGLELLTLGCGQPIADGTPMRQALSLAHRAGALPVIPWGFGKWAGRRGKLLADLLDSTEAGGICLGDNGGRPWFWPDPRPFTTGGRPVLPGSDPLPFVSHQSRAGSYGLLVDLSIDAEAPFARLIPRLIDRGAALAKFGRRAGSLGFARDQIAMQIVKRTRG